ncbi:MAG: response regulator [Acidobacteriota bacterium]
MTPGTTTSTTSTASDAFLMSLPARRSALMEHWYQWLSTGRERLGMERLFREVSAISEEASAAEAGDVAKCSEALRALMNEALANPAPVWSTTQAAIAAGLVRLDKACDAATAPSLVAMGSEGLAEVERFRVGVLDVDSERGESVGRQLEDMGYDVAVHGDVESLERDPEALNVLLLAHDAGPGGRQAASLSPEAIGPIVASLPGRPALVVASWRGDLGARLRALRAGAVAFLPQPIAAEDLATAIEEIAERARDGALRALVIDGDARAAGHASALLRRRGFVVRFIHDVADALPAMAQASPDVVVSGISFPEHTGLELAKVLRQDPRFAGTPFVFVAPDESVAAVRREVRLGGDEVVPMALRDAELADVALGRACRYRALRSHLSQDALTGCASQDAVREALKVELSRAHRDATPVSHAVVEIDRLAAVSKRFGPAAADRAVLVLARLLRQRLGDRISSDATGPPASRSCFRSPRLQGRPRSSTRSAPNSPAPGSTQGPGLHLHVLRGRRRLSRARHGTAAPRGRRAGSRGCEEGRRRPGRRPRGRSEQARPGGRRRRGRHPRRDHPRTPRLPRGAGARWQAGDAHAPGGRCRTWPFSTSSCPGRADSTFAARSRRATAPLPSSSCPASIAAASTSPRRKPAGQRTCCRSRSWSRA